MVNRTTVLGFIFRLFLIKPKAYATAIVFVVIQTVMEYYSLGYISEHLLIHNPCLVAGDVLFDIVTGREKYSLSVGTSGERASLWYWVCVWKSPITSFLVVKTAMDVIGYVTYRAYPKSLLDLD